MVQWCNIRFWFSGQFGFHGKAEDYFYLNQSGVYMIDGKDDKEDYVAMRVRSMMDLSYLCFMFVTKFLSV